MGAIRDILDFWFDEVDDERRFKADPDLDREIADRFGETFEAAAAGALDGWQGTPEGALALVILLDQFPRNMFRDTPRAFATDGLAREVASRAIEFRLDQKLSAERRCFVYLPFQHSEDIDAQRRSVALTRERADMGRHVEFAERHLAVIERFGRFPHRNEILGRKSTPEEAAYLADREEPY